MYWECDSVVEHMPSMCEATDLIYSSAVKANLFVTSPQSSQMSMLNAKAPGGWPSLWNAVSVSCD